MKRALSPESIDETAEACKRLKECVIRVEKTIAELKDGIQKLELQALLLRGEIRNIDPNDEDNEPDFMLIPETPFTDMNELLVFDDNLHSSENLANLVRDFVQINATYSEEFVRKCWEHVIHEELVKSFTWNGTASKAPGNVLLIKEAIERAFREKYINESLYTVEETSEEFFTDHRNG